MHDGGTGVWYYCLISARSAPVYNEVMRRPALAMALLAPALILTVFWLRPDLDPSYRIPILHFYVVTFTSLAATVISFLLIAALGSVARPRHLLAAVAFAVMGSLFSVHGLTTPGALIPVSHPAVPAVSLSSWLTLFSGGVIFAIAGMDRPHGLSHTFLVRFIVVTAGAVMLFISVVVAVPQWLGALEASAAPWHRRLLFGASFVVWIIAAVQLFRTWRETRNRIDGALAIVAGLLAQATVSMHLFPLWNLSWWSYHFILLGSFLLTVTILFSTYEQAREFRLSRYFLAAASVLTVFLALVASFLFSRFAERALTDHIVHDVQTMLEAFVEDAGKMLPLQASVEEVRETFAARLGALPVDAAAVYDLEGHRLHGRGSNSSYYAAGSYGPMWQNVLRGETVVNIVPPGAGGDGIDDYGGAAPSSAHVAYGYLTVGNGPQPVGVLVTRTEVSHLSEAIMHARLMGLTIAALTMGLLFTLLWLVVRRADSIIAARSEELASAYRDLRQAEAMRDDLTHMIVHDLRTPLTAILMSLGLLKRLPQKAVNGASQNQHHDRVVDRTTRAAQRLDQMIDDILMVSKIEKGEFRPRRREVSLSQLLDEQLDPYYLQATAEEKSLNLECPHKLRATIDPALTGRVVENLVSNAFKYTSRGGCITVSAQNYNGTLALSVRDDGEGIPDAYKRQIFGKYSQAPVKDGHQVRKGIGLGLAFCRLAVEAHGGTIWVQDAPGGGSEFRMEMPRE